MLPVDLVIALVVLLIIIIVVTSISWAISGVPYVPTSRSVVWEMIRLARLEGAERVYDIGAGDGRILIEAKRAHPGLRATGIEFSPTVWLLGRLRILLSGQAIELRRGDARTTDLRDADAVFLYLSPGMMAQLEGKFDEELRPGAVVIAHAFRFPRRQPVETVRVGKRRWAATLLRYEW